MRLIIQKEVNGAVRGAGVLSRMIRGGRGDGETSVISAVVQRLRRRAAWRFVLFIDTEQRAVVSGPLPTQRGPPNRVLGGTPAPRSQPACPGEAWLLANSRCLWRDEARDPWPPAAHQRTSLP